MIRLPFVLETDQGEEHLELPVHKNFNMGWTIKDEEKQRRHIEEVRAAGVRIPEFKRTPVIFPVSDYVATTSSSIQMQRENHCGEVEFFLMRSKGHDLIGVASDHTDRDLESHWIPWSKQAGANVLSKKVWNVADVRPHISELRMRCMVRMHRGEWQLYQDCTLGEFVEPEFLWESVKERIRSIDEDAGVVLLSGTVVTEHETLERADEWRISLEDPVLNRKIEHTYTVEILQRQFIDQMENES